jgi:Uncharacterized protein conserved in bacteria
MKRILLLVCLVFFTRFACGQYSLDIEITGIRNSKGRIMLQLFDENQKVIGHQMGDIDVNKCNLKFTNLKPGKYAVRYFHDENLSQKLETNALGIPKEGYGYSNNAAGLFGPPSFDKWIFELNGDRKIQLKPTY